MNINNVVVVGTGLVGSLMRTKLELLLKGTNYVVVPYKSDVFVEDISSGNLTTTNIRLVILACEDENSRRIIHLLPYDIKVLDMSSAFRTEWEYGFGYDNEHTGYRVANPGCFATAIIYGLAPIIKNQYLHERDAIYIDGVAGRSVGGLAMISQFENGELPIESVYGLTKPHHHLPEIRRMTGHVGKLWFKPKVISNIYSGMRIQFMVPYATMEELIDMYTDVYRNPNVRISNNMDLDISKMEGQDGVDIRVRQLEEDCLVAVMIDNLKIGSVSQALHNVKRMLYL